MNMRENTCRWAVISLILFIAYGGAFADKTIYVDDDAAGANDGSSWPDAYKFLQDALADANSADKPVEIRVAQGIYRPDRTSSEPNGTGDRTATFQLISGVTLKGGYAGLEQADPNVRDIEAYETILSGDLAGNDVDVNDPCDLHNEPTRVENSFHVVTGSGTDESSVLDAFTITGGNARTHRNDWGGGMYNEYGCSRITNCKFISNSAEEDGGGMYNNSKPTLINCTFIENTAGTSGGGIVNNGGFPSLKDCTFYRNSAGLAGGGMMNSQSGPILSNCTFIGNLAEKGAGISNSNSDPILANCTFVANSAARGNAVDCSSSDRRNSSRIDLSNCILWDGGDEIRNADDSRVSISYSDVQGGRPGKGNIDVDPLFADPNNGDYHLKSQAGRWGSTSESWVKDDVTSPCIDAGDMGSPIGDEPFPNGGRINMGAYGSRSQASKSYFGEPVCETIVAGDINGDCKVDFVDFALMANNWLEDNSPEVPDFYYYHYNQKMYLELYTAMIAVYFEDTVSQEQKEALIESDPALEEIITEWPRYGLVLVGTKDGSSDVNIIRAVYRLEKLAEVRYSTPVFGHSTTQLILTDEFAAKFKLDVTPEEIDAFNTLNGVEIEDIIEGIEHYILRVKDPKNMNTLKIANLYSENAITIFSVPNWIAIGEPP
jgi:hypothetical protein